MGVVGAFVPPGPRLVNLGLNWVEDAKPLESYIFRLAQLTMTAGALPMLKFFKFLFRRRPSEPLPADVAELNSALEKLRAALRSKPG